MKKIRIKHIVCTVLVLAAALAAVVPVQSAAYNAGSWMSALDDNTKINTLSIPGTHDSGATHSIADLSGKCQSLTIEEQLKMGVRFFDIRLRLNNNRLDIVHSFVDQGISFQEVLDDMTDFLRENPDEFLFVSVKEDNEPKGSDMTFPEKLEEMLTSVPDIISTSSSVPETVGDARGKIHIISRYDDSSSGIPAWDGWLDSTSFSLGELYVQDNYKVAGSDIKKADILAAFEEAKSLEHGLVLNFTSCYIPGGFPPTYAGTPALEINPWLLETIPEQEGALGVFVSDFVTSELVKIIIERNFQ